MVGPRRRSVDKPAGRSVAAGIIAALAVSGCGGTSDLGMLAAARSRMAPRRAGSTEPMRVGRWAVAVSLSRSRIGPLAITTTPVRRAPDTSSRPWIQHDVRISNVGRRRVHLGDTRRSAYLRGSHDRALLGADEGCGYGRASVSDPIEVGVCASYLDAPTLGPGQSIKRTVTLFKGLEGMEPLGRGTYVFPRSIRFEMENSRRWTRRLEVLYEVEARVEGRPPQPE
jgi:hypothetical protein